MVAIFATQWDKFISSTLSGTCCPMDPYFISSMVFLQPGEALGNHHPLPLLRGWLEICRHAMIPAEATPATKHCGGHVALVVLAWSVRRRIVRCQCEWFEKDRHLDPSKMPWDFGACSIHFCMDHALHHQPSSNHLANFDLVVIFGLSSGLWWGSKWHMKHRYSWVLCQKAFAT